MTETIKQNPRTYIPAAGYDWLLPLYDPLQKLLGSESDHRDLLNQAGLEPGHRVLEIGCGTGNLAILTKLLYPGAKVVGLDPDPKALTRAKLKAQREAVSVHFDCGFSHELPYPNESFDRVFSSFMFHHLNLGEKKQTLEEARRVLAPGGSLHLLDFGGANTRPEGLIAACFTELSVCEITSEAGSPHLCGKEASQMRGRLPIESQSSGALRAIAHLRRPQPGTA